MLELHDSTLPFSKCFAISYIFFYICYKTHNMFFTLVIYLFNETTEIKKYFIFTISRRVYFSFHGSKLPFQIEGGA